MTLLMAVQLCCKILTALLCKMNGQEFPEVTWNPFHGIFYHLMLSKDNTTIMFYNKPLYNKLLAVLSKQFKFPSEGTQTFTVKMHVHGKKVCFLYTDKRMMTIRASGLGHLLWKKTTSRNCLKICTRVL